MSKYFKQLKASKLLLLYLRYYYCVWHLTESWLKYNHESKRMNPLSRSCAIIPATYLQQ